MKTATFTFQQIANIVAPSLDPIFEEVDYLLRSFLTDAGYQIKTMKSWIEIGSSDVDTIQRVFDIYPFALEEIYKEKGLMIFRQEKLAVEYLTFAMRGPMRPSSDTLKGHFERIRFAQESAAFSQISFQPQA